jgi:LCP family protein required for cell wall assembly
MKRGAAAYLAGLPAPERILVTRQQLFRRALQVLGLLILAVSLTSLGTLYYVGHSWSNPGGRYAPIQETRGIIQAAVDPEQLFPGQTRINILCMGLDRNWTNQDLPYSTGTRTDTMMVVSLDLPSQRAWVLSVPRDMRVEIPRHGLNKINDAYRIGGVELVRQTVEQFLGARMDYFVLVKLGAVQRFIDAIGGIAVDVEKDMSYDDNWGQLHIHLARGIQHLNGTQVEGYMRFRHDAESDFGRMRRQQQTMKAVLAKLQSPSVAFRVPKLIDAFNKSIETDLTRDQILGLANLFHRVRPDDVVSDTVPGRDDTVDGISYLEPIEGRQKILVDWLLRGEDTAANRLTTVRVLNGCNSRKTTNWVVRQLADQEFRVVYAGRASDKRPITQIGGRGRHPDAAQRVANTLQVSPGGQWEPDKQDPIVTVIVGQDQVSRARTEGPT